VSNLPFS
jgi:hypothetical protein